MSAPFAGAAAVFFLLLTAGLSTCRSEPHVIIATKSGNEHAVRVEIADTPAKREMGLQYRNDLADDQGMLFLFPAEEVLTFWMKNTPIPLDMIFIGSDMKIAGIVHNAVPFSLTPRSVGAPSRYVLEIKGGLAKQKGIEAGDTVRFEGVSLEGIRN
ncbi:MAG: DUF192 domain-containing protein [Candidatus Binatia bacterium]